MLLHYRRNQMTEMIVKRRSAPEKIDELMTKMMNRPDQETVSVSEAEVLKRIRNQDVPGIDRFVKKKMVTKNEEKMITMRISATNVVQNQKKAETQMF